MSFTARTAVELPAFCKSVLWLPVALKIAINMCWKFPSLAHALPVQVAVPPVSLVLLRQTAIVHLILLSFNSFLLHFSSAKLHFCGLLSLSLF